MRTCVVIPTYNEYENIDKLISQILDLGNIDILVVDDSSPDGTADKVRIWEDKSEGRVSLLSRSEKNGLGGAYVYGFNHCLEQGYEIICQMDADLSHDPKALPSLIAPVASDEADLVIGSRYIPGGSIPKWSLFRRALSRGGNIYARIMLKVPAHDCTGGFRAYRKVLLTSILKNGVKTDGYGFQIEMTYLSGLSDARIVEVPITFTERVHGESKMSFSITLEALALVTRLGLRDRILGRKKAAQRIEAKKSESIF